MPVARDVLRHAAATPDRAALVLDGDAGRRRVSYAELAERASRGAERLSVLVGSTIARGDVVAIAQGEVVGISQSGFVATDDAVARDAQGRWAAALAAVLAVDLAGGVPLLCPEGWAADHRDELVGSVGAHHRVSVDDLVGTDPLGTDRLGSDGTAHGARHVRTTPTLASSRADGTDLAWAGFTSGSTGRPRAVVRSRVSWTGSFDEVTRVTGTAPGSSVLVPGDLATSLYCFGALHALAVGSTVHPAPRPGDLAATAPGCDVLHVTPAQLEASLDVLERADAPGDRLVRRTALVGGAHLPADLRARATALGLRVVSYYGAAELSFVAIDVDGAGLRPFPGVEIDVRRAEGAPLGTVWVRSPWLAEGYLAHAPGPLERAGGWATVGDRAEMPTDDVLVLRGRGSGALSVGASTVLPEDVEAVLAAVPGVREVAVLGTAHPRWGQVVTAVVALDPALGDDRHDERLLDALESAARAGLSPAQRPRRWFGAQALPRTAGGKVARARLAELLPATPAPGEPVPVAGAAPGPRADRAPGIWRLRRSPQR